MPANAVTNSLLFQLDIPLSLVFFKWLLGQEHTFTASDLHYVDPVLAKSFKQLDDLLRQKKRIDSDRSHVSQKQCGAADCPCTIIALREGLGLR